MRKLKPNEKRHFGCSMCSSLFQFVGEPPKDFLCKSCRKLKKQQDSRRLAYSASKEMLYKYRAKSNRY